VTIFDNKNFYYDVAASKLFKSLMDRDALASFSLDIFREFSKNYLFKNMFDAEPTQITVLQNYYNIARGSLDLPFSCSLAAHGYVSCLVLKKFGTPRFIYRYQQDMETGEKIAAINNSENGSSVSLKKIKAKIVESNEKTSLEFHKPCVTNGGVADLLFTTLWNNDKLEIYVLDKTEVKQVPIGSQLIGFRTGDTGSVTGGPSSADLFDRRLTTDQQTIKALKYGFYIERLIVSVMATGLAHGLEDFLIKSPPPSLVDALGDNKQYLQEKVLKLHTTRILMSSLIETVINRGPDHIMNADSELSILKMMISNELRAAVYGCIEVIGHWALNTNNILPKILRDIQMCSFFGGTQELQKVGLYSSMVAASQNDNQEKNKPKAS
jgi:alkylation response protein AidB-like acyl-CoA dehydrogenase